MSRLISHSLRWKPPTLSMPKHQQLPSDGQVAVACPVNHFQGLAGALPSGPRSCLGRVHLPSCLPAAACWPRLGGRWQ